MARNKGKSSKYVKCRVCERMVGRMGIQNHASKHKREFLEKKGIDKGWKETDHDYDDVVEFFNPEILDGSGSSQEIKEEGQHVKLDSFEGKTTDEQEDKEVRM